MTDYLWNLAAYSVQLAALVSAGFLTLWILRLRVPNMSLRFWQAVMTIAVLLPLAQPQRGNDLLQAIVQSAPFASVTVAGSAMAPAGFDAALIAIAILATGVVLRLAWLGLGLLRLRSIVGNATLDSSLTDTAHDLSRSLDVTAPIMISDALEGPATVGVRHPVVLVPRAVLQMPVAVQRAILCHELIHVRRRDWLHTIVEEIWCALLWFHPGARVIASRLSLARETVVDEMTILITKDRRAYAEALLAFSDPQPHLIGATPFIGRRTLSQRISLIAEEASMSRHRALFGFAIALAAVLGSTATAVSRFPMSGALTAQSRIYEPGNGVSLPKAVHEVMPEYTQAALQHKIQGSVILQIVVDDTGDVTDVQVVHSLDSEFGLDQEAMNAAWQWKFKPGTQAGQPVAVRVTLQMRFTLR